LRKLIKNNESLLPSASGAMPKGKGWGPAVVEAGGGATSRETLEARGAEQGRKKFLHLC
jgi:hypothetical protein